MGSIKVKHLVPKPSGFYFQATPAMKAAGILSEPLGKDPVRAVTRARELNKRWDQHRTGAAPKRHAHGSVAWLIAEYKKSEWYTSLEPRTLEEVDRHLDVIERSIGKAQVTNVRRKQCRTIHSKVMETKSRDNANRTIKWLRRVLSYAVELEMISENPAFGMQLRHNKPRTERWTKEELKAFVETAIGMGRTNWALAVMIGYDTSQRISDILRVTWNDFDGEGIYFRQSKGGVETWCPLEPETIRMLGEQKRYAVQILVGDYKKRPIANRSVFNKTFNKIKRATAMRQNLQFKDLRRTAASEILAEGGRAEPITGHRPGSPTLRIYEVPDKRAARNAQRIRRGDSGTKFEK